MGNKQTIGFKFENFQGNKEDANKYYTSAEHIIHLSA